MNLLRPLYIALLTSFLCAAAARADEPAWTKDIEYARPDGISLKLDALVPPGAGPFPACIIVHGGGYTKGDKQSYVTPLFEPLARAGFACFTIDYRLGTQARWPACIDDLAAALRWVKAHAAEHRVDAARIALIGESSGGHMVSYAGTRRDIAPLCAAVVPMYAPHDFEMQVRNRNKLGDSMTALLGLTELNDHAWQKLREISATTHVRENMPPYLLIHGEKDASVPFEQSVIFQNLMREKGNVCDLIAVPNAGHGMGKFDSKLPDWKDRMIAWLRNHLK